MLWFKIGDREVAKLAADALFISCLWQKRGHAQEGRPRKH